MSRIFTLIKNSFGGAAVSNTRAIAKERLSIMLTEQRSELSSNETAALLKEVEATVMKYAKVSRSKTPTFAVLKDARDLYYLEFHFPLENRKMSGTGNVN